MLATGGPEPGGSGDYEEAVMTELAYLVILVVFVVATLIMINVIL